MLTLTICCPGSENLTWISFRCFRMGSSCSWCGNNSKNNVKIMQNDYISCKWDKTRTCSMSLSMSTLLNMVSQKSGMPFGSSSGLVSSFFASSIEAFSFIPSYSTCTRHTDQQQFIKIHITYCTSSKLLFQPQFTLLYRAGHTCLT